MSDFEFEKENEIEDSGSLEFSIDEFKKKDYKSEKVEELIDANSGEVIDRSSLKPMDYIRAIAKKTGNIIKDPNPSCKKCYGRGHINSIEPGSDTLPIPCSCLYTKEARQAEGQMPYKPNRAQQRKLNKSVKKLAERYRKILKNKSHEEFLKKEESENGN